MSVAPLDTGVYELDPQGRRCFRPAAPRFPAIEDILDVLEPATAAIREFDRALSAWDRPGLVGRLFARLDAVHSSGAEGSTTTFSELMEYQTSLHRAPDPADAAAVAACVEAIEEEPREVDPVATTLAIYRRLFAHARDPMVAQTAGSLKLRANGTADPDAPGGFFYYTQPASVAAVLHDWRAFTLASEVRRP
jgi:cell filamentation protein, protein adenylyltransferase